MEFLRAGEALLRSSQPILPFLAPQASRTPNRLGTTSTYCRPRQWQPSHTKRAFTSSHAPRQQDSAAARKEESEYAPRPTPGQSSQDADPFAMFDKALDRDKGVPTASTGGTSHFRTASAQQAARDQKQSAPAKAKSAMDELLEGLGDQYSPRRQQFPSMQRSPPPPNTTMSSQASAHSSDAIANMLNASFGLTNTRTSSLPSAPPPPPRLEPAPFKLDSTVGRTIQVNSGVGIDVGRAFRMLDQRCALNSVRRDFQRQRFHERPGLKRKRLKSERWRKRFKEQFQQTVRTVVKMKAQGW